MQQFQYLGALICSAWLMGFVFDIYDTVTGASKWLRWLRPTLDFVFWTGSAVLVYYVVFVTDAGRLRLYTFAVLAVGYLLYRAILHRQVVASAFVVVRMIRATVKFFYGVLYALLIRPVWMLCKLIGFLLARLYQLGCLIENGLFWVLRFWVRFAGWPFRGIARGSSKSVTRIEQRWEGIWDRVSKWLKKDSERV